jgi:hypothetical protein
MKRILENLMRADVRTAEMIGGDLMLNPCYAISATEQRPACQGRADLSGTSKVLFLRHFVIYAHRGSFPVAMCTIIKLWGEILGEKPLKLGVGLSGPAFPRLPRKRAAVWRIPFADDKSSCKQVKRL